ncbi:MAG: hypothetical protein U1E10_19305, partial [Bdellovibrionales bacterium]|nr:hypothetical protein [Bdellovibrionales bacterium]
MKLLRVIASTLLLFLVTAFSFQAGASDLTREEKIKRIMSVAEKAKEPRNFYRWQSETSGNNLLAAGEYNEKLFNYFMTMTIDEAHFAGGRGVYYAENITSSAQFIRGDGKGSLIEVRIPKGMPTLDLTNQKTLKKLEQLGITTNDVLFLDPPLAVRYSSSGWWAVKRREGVKFQPFNVDRLPLSSLLKDLKALKDYPRAAEVLEVHLTQRAEKEVAKNAAILVQEPRLQGLVSKRTLERAISKSKDLQQYYAEKFKSDQYADLPGNHFGTIVSTARKLGFEIDESKMFANLTTQQKLSFLDEVYPAGSAPEATLNALLNDENVKQTSFQLKPDELKTVERHLLPLIQKRPDILVESARAYHLLSIENLVSLLQKNPKLVQHFTEQLKSKYLDLPIGQDVGPVLMGFRAAGVDFNEQHIFTYMEIPKRLQFLNHFYPDRAPPRAWVDMLVSNEGLRWATTSPFVTSSLTATLSRIAEQDAELLIRNPISFQYVNSDTLEKVLAGNQASRDVLHAQFESGKFSGINEKALLQLRAALAASGKPVSEEGLFRNLDLDAKLAFLQKKFTKNKISVPHTYYHALLEDQTIQRNGQISDASLEKLGQYANDALHEVKDDVGLINKATRLFGFGK